jgi:hypothetical protein
MRQRTTKHKNITRVDHPKSRTHGYSVRIMWKGERRAKFFSDGVYGDRMGAFFAAKEWRDKTEKELGKPRTERLVLGTPRSDLPVVGVRRVREGHTDYYEATWATFAGKQRRTRFSVAKHGEKRALQLARKARQNGERERLRTPSTDDD